MNSLSHILIHYPFNFCQPCWIKYSSLNLRCVFLMSSYTYPCCSLYLNFIFKYFFSIIQVNMTHFQDSDKILLSLGSLLWYFTVEVIVLLWMPSVGLVHDYNDNIHTLLRICVTWSLSRKFPAMYYVKWRHLLKIQDTRNIVHRTMMSQSPSK